MQQPIHNGQFGAIAAQPVYQHPANVFSVRDLIENSDLDINTFADGYWGEVESANSKAFDDTGARRPVHTLIGKIGELAVHRLFGGTAPDCSIWTAGQRKVNRNIADIVTPDADLHVKTADLGSGHEGWVIHKATDRFYQKPGPRDWFVLVELSADAETVEVIAVVRPEVLWRLERPCNAPSLRDKGAISIWPRNVYRSPKKHPGDVHILANPPADLDDRL